jgi:hypothetical protein
VILVDGEAAGTWAREQPEFFDRATKQVREAVDRRLDEVRAFLA